MKKKLFAVVLLLLLCSQTACVTINIPAQESKTESEPIVSIGGVQFDNSESRDTTRIYINDLDYFDKDGNGDVYAFRDAKANVGTEYEYGFKVYPTGFDEEVYATYYLDKEYSTFSGTIVLDFEERDSKEKREYKFYGDEVLLFTSDTMTAGALPQDFEIDVSGVTQLKIVSYVSSWDASAAIICDGVFTK